MNGLPAVPRPRRPSGHPASLRVGPDRIMWVATSLLGVVLGVTAWALLSDDPWWFGLDRAVNDWVASVRSSWLVDVADGVEWLGSPWSLRLGLWSGVTVLLVFRRWRQLLTLAAVVVLVEWSAERVVEAVARPLPVGAVAVRGTLADASLEVAGLAALLVGLGFSLVPLGRHRRAWFAASAAMVVVAGLARLVLGLDHLSDLVLGTLAGAATAVVAFRLFVPDDAFPIDYKRRRIAHLPVSGAREARLREALEEQLLTMEGPRADAMRRALSEQLGCDVVKCELVSLTPFGHAASAGSTPLRVSLEGRIRGDVFAKLYSMSHLRSDRWYKLGRAILYGRLEDERPFTSVRRLVEYEDYMLRVMRDAGLPSASPLGIVQIVPGREYLVVTEFFEGSTEIDKADVDEGIVDDALAIVRKLWDAGLAHRDIKPANILVHEGRVKLIDVAFGEIRPSPWRRSIDLANMMLILALRVDPELVYRRARREFTAIEIGDAFAAARGPAVPSQLRVLLKEHLVQTRVDLPKVFREMGPPRPRVPSQRWSLRRVGLTTAVVAGGASLVWLVVQNLRGVGLL